jgi:hypothetical protein
MAVENPYPSVRGPLLTGLIDLAASPEYLSTIESQLTNLVRLAAGRVAAADFASVAGLEDLLPVTVAVNDELIWAVDDTDPGDETFPDGTPGGTPAWTPDGTPDPGGTIRWPGFHDEAPRLGLHASVSVPLHTGCGQPVAVLVVYGRDAATMAPLIGGICQVRGLRIEGVAPLTDLGGQELVAGYAEALGVRDRIRQAIATIVDTTSCSADDAYVTLCIRAAKAGTDLSAAATSFLPPAG